MGDSRIKDVSSLLAAFFDEETRRRGDRFAGLFGSWKRIAGERLAAHSRVQDIENGILVVEAEHPGWIQLLQFKQAEMLEAARSLFPELELRGISFRLARDDRATGPGRASSAGAPRPGPFGPGGRPPAGVSEAGGEASREEAEAGGPAEAGEIGGELPTKRASLEDIKDDTLRNLLGELKKTVEGGKDEPAR